MNCSTMLTTLLNTSRFSAILDYHDLDSDTLRDIDDNNGSILINKIYENIHYDNNGIICIFSKDFIAV
jgi:hypothetical protein